MPNGKYKPSRAESFGSKLSNQKNPLGLGFSLNNPRRIDFHRVPQTQTPFRGNVPKGYGGGGGTITKSQYVCADAFNIPHVSVKNNAGMISTRYKWINRGIPHAIVKDVNPPSYDNYLQKIKGNVIKQAIPVSTNCYNSFIKNVSKPSYDTYLNSIKGNIVKNKFTINGVNINCNCPTNVPVTNNPVTLYYIENDVLLKDNEQILLGYSTTLNKVLLNSMIS